MSDKQKYEVLTYDIERGEFTRQCGLRRGPWTLMGLRIAIRKLRLMGYEGNRRDNSILVRKWSETS